MGNAISTQKPPTPKLTNTPAPPSTPKAEAIQIPGALEPDQIFQFDEETTQPAVDISKDAKLSSSTFTRSLIGSVTEKFRTILSFTEPAPPGPKPNFKNSSRIVCLGPEGLAPMLALNAPESEQAPDDTIPVLFTWAHGGKTVHVTGTFNEWKKKIRLNQSTSDFSAVIRLPKGTHKFKFIVDDEWKCSEDLPVATEEDGHLVNYLNIDDEYGLHQKDGLDAIAQFVAGVFLVILEGHFPLATRPDSPLDSYTTNIPDFSTYPSIEPPQIPPNLENIVLNTQKISKEDNSALPIPDHVSLNHLYACSLRDGVMAVATTVRFQEKFITTILYRPVSNKM